MPKLEEIKYVLSHSKIHILGLCETFLNKEIQDSDLQIPNFNCIRRDRDSRKGGGIVVYIKDNIPFQHKLDLNTCSLESVWIEIMFPNTKSFLINFIYRPPDSTIDWVSAYDISFKNAINCMNKELYILGDLNMNFQSGKDTFKNSRWNSFVISNGLKQLVMEPTRITKKSSTIIDHLYTNRPDCISNVFVSSYSVSDHFPVCFTRQMHTKIPKNKHISKDYRQFKHFKEHAFQKDLLMSNLNMIDTVSDPNTCLNYLLNTISSTLNIHAPIKTKRIKSDILPGWFSDEIKHAIKMRDWLKKHNKIDEYKKQRNHVTFLIRKYKQQFYNNSVRENVSTKHIWKTINSLAHPNPPLTLPLTLDVNNTTIDSIPEILDTFNTHFTNISDLITKTKFEPCHYEKFKTYLNDKLKTHVFEIAPITVFEVRKIIDSLKNNKAPGLDNIGPDILKHCGDSIVDPITSIINKSIQSGIFPDRLKNAYILPVHKESDKNDLNNYRPISILPTISKIIERHISNQMKSFFEKHQLLHTFQSGFRQNHSCQSSLIRLIDSWLQNIDSGQIVGSVYLDLKKAFDLVDHDILLNKMSMYHFSESVLTLMQSYLSNRQQCVKVGTQKSSFKTIKAGVPQGSILGPLLFLVYINDMPFFLQKGTLDLYADDSTLHVADVGIKNIQSTLQNDLNIISNWCSFNNMLIHPNKTKCMVLSSANKSTNTLLLKINNIVIEQVEHYNLLGVTVDKHLTWQLHINNVCRKLNSKLALLKRIKPYLNYETMKLFFNSYILPHMDYCCAIWCSATRSNLKKVISIQKRAAKIIMNKPFSSPSIPIFNKLGWLSFENRCTFLVGTIVYKVLHGSMPHYFDDVIFVSNNNTYSLRSTTHNDLSSVAFKTNYGKRTFAYCARNIWNFIPNNIRQAPSLISFKRHFKNHLLQTQNLF